MNLFVKLLISSLAIMITQWILPGVHVESYFTGLVLAVVLGLLNTFIKPLLVIITLPATVLSLGLFLFVINALIVLLADSFVDGFAVDNFFWALLFSLLLSIVSSFLEKLGKEEKNAN